MAAAIIEYIFRRFRTIVTPNKGLLRFFVEQTHSAPRFKCLISDLNLDTDVQR